MSMPVSLSHNRLLESASLRLCLAWGCGLLWGASALITLMPILASIATGLTTFGGGRIIALEEKIVVGLGLIGIFILPATLGFLLAGKRRGLVAGVVAVLVGGVGSFIFIYVLAIVNEQLRWSYLLQMLFAVLLSWSMLVGIFASAVIVTLIVVGTKPFLHRWRGLVTGTLIGLGLAVVAGIVFDKSGFPSDNVFHQIWQIPPLVWSSVVYLVDVARGTADRRALLTWGLLVLGTLGSLFIIVSQFCIGCQ